VLQIVPKYWALPPEASNEVISGRILPGWPAWQRLRWGWVASTLRRVSLPELRFFSRRVACWFLFIAMFGAGERVWVQAMPPVDGTGGGSLEDQRRFMKQTDMPNPLERAEIRQRQRLRQAQRLLGVTSSDVEPLLRKSGSDRVLVILVEFAGTNTFTWTPGTSTWDPLGRCDNSEFDGTDLANSAASTFFAQKYGITGPTNFTYQGPLHNEIARPLSAEDASSTMIWQPDFSPSYYNDIIFGSGVKFDYTREDGSVVHEDYTGRSVRDYYEDLSGGAYTITGSVLGWVQVPNSVWYYGGDGLPGARSCPQRPAYMGAIPGGGDSRTLVMDALRAAKAAYPDFDWASYDQNGDGLIDRLWIIHAGLGEEDHPALLNRTSYGEGGMWSHSWSLGSPFQVVPGVSTLSFIMMPENAGIAVLSHEFGHNLGAMDLYTYGDGQTSAGFWTLMSDSWVGYPLGFLPQAMDPMHLDEWGWLDPFVVSDPSKVYSVTLGQASRFPGGSNEFRAVKIELANGVLPLPVRPHGLYEWWGGKEGMSEGRMRLAQAIHIPPTGGTLEFQTAYDTESGYDFFYVEVSTDGGASWQRLASYSGRSTSFPNYRPVSLSLAGQAGQDVLIRFRYTTDPYIEGEGVFVDDVAVYGGSELLLADDAETEQNLWTYQAPWRRTDGTNPNGYTHNYYLQWRNTSPSGGYDEALGDSRFRFGPADTGLIVWYQDDRYSDNSIFNHLKDAPSFGPKGKLLVVDAHPEPQLDPYWVARGVTNEIGNVFSRGSMRDAAFSRWPTASYHLQPPFAFEPADFAGRPAQPQFSDALGYYPGIESMGNGSWRTRQWDASVVVPARNFYGVRGPGYAVGDPLDQVMSARSFLGTNEYIDHWTNVVSGGLTQPGGDGNPGSINAAFGWNARIVWQTNQATEVVIWNDQFASLDDDGDSVPNWQEALAGTDPKDATSYLRVTRVEREPNGPGIWLEWTSASNRIYRVVRASALTDSFTNAVGTDLPATPPRNSFLDPNPGGGERAFYRIELQ